MEINYVSPVCKVITVSVVCPILQTSRLGGDIDNWYDEEEEYDI